MPSVRYNKEDNNFIVKSGVLIYMDTLENMQTDSGMIFPSLPQGIKHYYFNDVKKFAKYSDGQSETDAPQFVEAVILINDINILITAKDARENPVIVLSLTEKQAKRKTEIKAEAQNYIYARYSNEHQNNLLARGLEIQRNFRISGVLTAQESADESSILNAWVWISSVRAEENLTQDLILNSPAPETIAANWPA